MRTYRDAKAMAKALRGSLAERQVELSHSDCLELVSIQFGEKNWNILADKIAAKETHTSLCGLKAPIPILRIFSQEKAMEFYIDFLGFDLEWEHRFAEKAPLYMQVSRGDATLHLSEHHGDASPGAAVFFWMSGIVAYHEELLAKGYVYNRPGLEEVPWDVLKMEMRDPFGNRLVFNEHHTDKDRRK